MISLIEDSCVEKKQWITHDDMMTVTVVAESTPGPIAINCATFVGYRQRGMAGAASATVGMVLLMAVLLVTAAGKVVVMWHRCISVNHKAHRDSLPFPQVSGIFTTA